MAARLALLILVALSGPEPPVPRPAVTGVLGSLPAGWLYLPMDGVDSWVGAYHDSVSGTFLAFSVCHRSYTGCKYAAPPAYVEDGSFGERRYWVVGSRRQGPQAECPSLLIEMAMPGTRWYFSGRNCGSEQERRLRELLLSNATEVRAYPNEERQPLGGPTAAQATDLALGTPWTQVVARFGRPFTVGPHPAGGFVARFFVAPLSRERTTGRLRTVRVVVDQGQRVTDVGTPDEPW